MSESALNRPKVSSFDLSGLREPKDGILYLYKSSADRRWYIESDEDMALQEATGYPVGEIVEYEEQFDDNETGEEGFLIAIFVGDPGEDPKQVTDGDALDAEAEALVELFNDAAPDYAPDLEWWAMDTDHKTGTQRFVFEATGYIDKDGLTALRDAGRTIEYIEANHFDGENKLLISVPVHGEQPDTDEPESSQPDHDTK